MTAGRIDRTYDIFEITPAADPLWRTSAIGREAALTQFEALAEQCPNELWAVDLATGEILAGVTAVDSPTSRLPDNRNILLEIIGDAMAKKQPPEQPSSPRRPAAHSDSGSALAGDVLQRGKQALANCEEMLATNSRILEHNHELMTGTRRGMKSRRAHDEKKSAV
jgi:hypothetical protein